MIDDKGLTEAETECINKHFPRNASLIFENLKKYKEKWKLTKVVLIEYFSVSCLFYCQSEKYGEAVFKVVHNCFEVKTEVNYLFTYQNKSHVKLYDYDLEDRVILLERIMPGHGLRNLQLEKRIDIFCELFKGLHSETNTYEYPNYQSWLTNMLEFLKEQKAQSNLYLKLIKANELYLELKNEYASDRLLHGDLHHDNILLDSNNYYKIIDPRGVIGNPIFDIGRFIHNEFTEEDEVIFKIKFIIDRISNNLSIPKAVINKVLFIDVVLSNSWNIEDGQKIDQRAIELVENLINE